MSPTPRQAIVCGVYRRCVHALLLLLGGSMCTTTSAQSPSVPVSIQGTSHSHRLSTSSIGATRCIQDGTLCVWTTRFQLQQTTSISGGSGLGGRRRSHGPGSIWVTSCVLACGRLVVATTGRMLCFYDTTSYSCLHRLHSQLNSEIICITSHTLL